MKNAPLWNKIRKKMYFLEPPLNGMSFCFYPIEKIRCTTRQSFVMLKQCSLHTITCIIYQKYGTQLHSSTNINRTSSSSSSSSSSNDGVDEDVIRIFESNILLLDYSVFICIFSHIDDDDDEYFLVR